MRETSKRRTLQELNLADDFLFGKVMSDTHLCKLFLEKLLKIEIERIQIVETQKTVKPIFENKGVRFDVYVKDDLVPSFHQKVEVVKQDKRTEVEFMTLEEKLERRQKEGQIETQLEIAKNLKNKGIDLAVICECTGLSEDEVGAL